MSGWREKAFALEAINDSTRDAVVAVDEKGCITYLNRTMAEILGKITGFTKKALLGKQITEIVPLSGLSQIIVRGQSPMDQQVTLGDKTFIANRTPIFRKGKVVGAVAVLQDVTELQYSLEQLANAIQINDILQTILDSVYDWIVVVDEDARIMHINQAYCDFLGVERSTVVGKPVQEVIENTRMHVVVKTGRAELGQVQRIKNQDMICNRIPIKRGDRIIGAVGIAVFRDVSELYDLFNRVHRLLSELVLYKKELRRYLRGKYCLEDLVGESPAMQEVKKLARRVAWSDSTILIKGESGTGKELLAHGIHNASSRATGPFVRINCAAIPENLLEAELFGYREGAFTGARRGGQIGKFELANQGTIFLDEIGDMPLSMQAKLLRVLQEKEIEPLGANQVVKVDVRVIAATNRDLEQMAAAGRFRTDLLYRLEVVVLEIPPLRERKEDIPLLVDYLAAKIGTRLGTGKKSVAPEVLSVFAHYHWPGNVRELENVLERVINIVDGPVIAVAHLPPYLYGRAAPLISPDGSRPLKEILAETEKRHIQQVLASCRGDKILAAARLGISKSSLYEKIARYNLQ